jgi:catechol 2,3-dioxygenase
MTSTSQIFGSAADAQPALEGSYGYPPSGFRLPSGTQVGEVHLAVADVQRSTTFYETVLGLSARVVNDTTQLYAQDASLPLVVLHEQSGLQPSARRGHLGLFHFAILLPDRPSLGRFVRHLGEIGAQAGAGDHLVSEAFYLGDPDGHGIEVYADRPRDTWRRQGRELMMATDPVDVASLVAVAGEQAWTGMPAGTRMGHVHLHVGDIERAGEFYSEALGFDRMVTRYPGALFLAAGGYHHHLGTNTWAGPGAKSPTEHDVRLMEWTLVVPDAATLDAVMQSLEAKGHAVQRAKDAIVTRDPWDTQLRIVVRQPIAS